MPPRWHVDLGGQQVSHLGQREQADPEPDASR